MPEDIAKLTHALNRLATSTVADVRDGLGWIALDLRRLSGSGTIAGRALTVRCHEGSSRAVGRALQNAQPGDVLCISAPFETACAGDLVTAEMERKGIAAVILDGFARDAASLAQSPISFFVRGTNPVARKTLHPGDVGINVTLGGVIIQPGDWIVADDDGVMVIPQTDIETVVAQASLAAEREDRILARIRGGMPIADAFAAEQ